MLKSILINLTKSIIHVRFVGTRMFLNELCKNTNIHQHTIKQDMVIQLILTKMLNKMLREVRPFVLVQKRKIVVPGIEPGTEMFKHNL